jgi:hypothetical protein
MTALERGSAVHDITKTIRMLGDVLDSTPMLDRSSYLVGLSIRWPECTHPMVDDCTRAWECWGTSTRRNSSVGAAAPALPCWIAIHTGRSSVFVGRRLLVQWWMTALEPGSASPPAATECYFAVAAGGLALPCWMAVHTWWGSEFVGWN